MKRIYKLDNEPKALSDFKEKALSHNSEKENNLGSSKIDLNYETFSKNKQNFADLREQLLIDQGFICCYCMQRIGTTNKNAEIDFRNLNMKTEHFKPQKRYFDLQVDYNNLLGACKGDPEEFGKVREEKRPYFHCDTIKDDYELKYIPNPASKEFDAFEENIAYQIVGKEIYILHKNDLCSEELGPRRPQLLEKIPKSKHLHLNEQNLSRDRFNEWECLCYKEGQLPDIIDWNITNDRLSELEQEYGKMKEVPIKKVSHNGEEETKVYKMYDPFYGMTTKILSEAKKT